MMSATILSIPSLANAVPPDTTPPVIGTPVFTPTSPSYTDKVTVWVNVTDNRSGVKNVTIVYTTDSWKTMNSSLTATYNATTTTAMAQIPSLANGGIVAFYIVAYDNNGNRQVNNNSGNYFTYTVTAPPSSGPNAITSSWLVYSVIAGVAAIVAVASVKILRKKQSESTTPSPHRTH